MSSAALEFGGTELFEATPQRLFEVLTDLDMLPQSIPDLQSSERIDERILRCVVRPGLAFIRGTMKLRIELLDLQPPTAATMQIDAQGIGATIQVQSQMKLTAEGPATRLDWEAAITQRKGLVATVSAALIRGAADQVMRHGWEQIRAKLAE
jgi:carbon monoxide dehydrogenase subunit G